MANFELVKPVEVIGGPTANVDALYGPYDSVSLAYAGVLSGLRAKGRTVGILENGSVVEYWWRDGIADIDLIEKGGGGSISDGDKGDITVSNDGDTWTIDNSAVTDAKVASGISATKIGTGDVDDTEFGQLDGITGNIQDQLDAKEILTNKSTDVVVDQASNTKYPSVKAVYDWAVATFQSALGFTPENVANKSTSIVTDQASDTKYPSVKAVYDWAVGLFVEKNTAITGDTKAKITYDAKGLVTAGADLTDADLPTGINADKIADGSVTNTEFQYIRGLTSDAQTQISNRLEKYTTAYPAGSNKNIFNVVALNQAEFDVLTPDASTLYFIID